MTIKQRMNKILSENTGKTVGAGDRPTVSGTTA